MYVYIHIHIHVHVYIFTSQTSYSVTPRKLYEDNEGSIFSVTLFKRAVCEFKAKAKESK